MKTIEVGNIKIGKGQPLLLIAGPCVIETEKITLTIAEEIKKITDKLNVSFIFKASYDKSNRSSVENYRGPGLKEGLRILSKVKQELGVPILSDVHCKTEVEYVKEVLDVIQIPAYLCMQTDIVVEAAKTKKVLNLKKGQFLAPWDMKKVVSKALSVNNDRILLTERGTIFGYNNMIFDLRSIPIMQEIGFPVIVDVTHIVRIPGPTSKDASGGQPQYISTYCYASLAAGANGLFIETHLCPEEALCDASSMLKLEYLEGILEKCVEIYNLINNKK
ncbi:MAG: 3-deoxy-8-phosphooctulonate synthase [Elusimicrobiota bacterium]|nr:3-deoxy-8-phosphooctulonate synthase [Endomicrobiia bacterium]MDW8164946.1 3-deoxy-8-phosphooctulonate synthase [Elusimicrobiota bacterium]